MNRQKQQSGFTLVELMIVVAIVGIIVSMAVPSFRRQIVETRLKDAVATFDSAIKDAKSQALITQRPVKVTLNSQTANTDKMLRVSYVSDNTLIAEYPLDRSLVVTTTGLPLSITARQDVFQGEQVTDVSKKVTDTGITIGFCSHNQSSDKYRLTINNRAMVKADKDGVCS